MPRREAALNPSHEHGKRLGHQDSCFGCDFGVSLFRPCPCLHHLYGYPYLGPYVHNEPQSLYTCHLDCRGPDHHHDGEEGEEKVSVL